ncbi:MAG: hypothetical protein KF802_16290 [Bdellovibrionaceae bacterium]|jgi:hypothetical protein|nr:hypothetical protein [Pseudobdellovibrionaceae bacterium]
MAQAKDLMTTGMAAPLATQLGFQVGAVTAAGTVTGTSTSIPANVTWANVTTASSQTGVKLPVTSGVNTVGQFIPYVVYSLGGQTCVVYPPSGETINGGSSVNVSNATFKTFYKIGSTTWVASQ